MGKRKNRKPTADFFDLKGDNNQQPGKTETNFFSITFAKEKLNEEERTIEVSLTSETPVKRWWGPIVLGHNPGECRLERIKTVGSFLFAHGRDPQYGVVPLGNILDVWLDENAKKYRAKLKFDTDEKSEIIFQKVKSGALKGISVGVEFYKWLEVEAGAEERGFAGPISIAVDWEMVEISLEPTPAFSNVGVGLKQESVPGKAGSEIGIKEDKKPMKFKVMRNGVEVEVSESELTSEERVQFGLDKAPAVKTEVKPEEFKAEEQERCLSIRKICSQFEISGEDEIKFVKENFSVEQVQQFALEKLAKERKPLATPNGQTVDETDKFRAAAVDGLSMRAGIKVEKPASGANDFRHFTLSQLMHFCYQRQHGKAFWGSPEELFDHITKAGEKLRFDGTERFSGPYASSSDFPLILANIANKSKLQAYQEAPTTYQAWCAIGTLKDFKRATAVRLSEAEGLKPLNEHGEFEHAEMTEAASFRQLDTKGIKWSLTRKMIINDDLDMFLEMPAKYAMAARRSINRDVYRLLKGNPVMDEDGQPMFNLVAHNNLPAAGAVVNATTLDAGYQVMMMQTDLQGDATLNLVPKFILASPARATSIAQFLGSASDPAMLIPGVPNPYYQKLVLVVDPELQAAPNGSQTAWRLLADPRMVKTIQVDFLNGRDEPIMESQVEFNMLGITYRMYHDWGVSAVDWRGAFMNSGA